MPVAIPQALGDTDRRRARAAAERLIAETRRNSAEYPVAFANHLPMLLEIQYQLGASAERLEQYAEIYNTSRRVPPAPPPVAPLGRADWRTAIGDRSRESDLRRFFTGESERLGLGGAIRAYLPALAPGVGASALHGLMRLAYAVLRNDTQEAGTALGYWASAFLPLRDEPDLSPRTRDPLDLARAMQAEPAFRSVAAGKQDLLWRWMRAVGQMDAFAPLIGRLELGPDALDRVADACLALYGAGVHSLEGVHAMTGAWWVRLVSPHTDAPEALVRHFWQAILAVYPKIDMPAPAGADALEALRAAPAPPAIEIARATLAFDPLADDEEHHPSAVFTAFQEYARTGDRLYLVLAAKRVRLID
jgi:hypothetical protein